MQALYKMVASFLSVALIFTSVAPSFAQTRSNSPFKVSGSNALGDAVNRHVTQTLEKAEDAYWVERGTKLVATQQRVVTLPYIVETLEKAKENAPKQDILQAQVCDKENLNCVPALAYAWGGVHYAAKNLLYYQAKPIIETAPQLATLITEYGLHSEQDRQAVRTYFYKLIKEADGDCDSGFMQRYLEVGSESNRVDARQANANKAKRCQAEVSVLPALAMIEKTPYEKQLAAKEIYSLLKSGYDQDQGAEIMYSAVTALGVLDTEQAYRHLDRFLTQDTIPSVAGNVWEGLWSPGKSSAQNALRAASNIRGGNSRYLNRINEQFQYLDKAEAKRQGFNNTAWQSEGRQYPYGNVLEEIGVFLGQQSTSSAFAKNLAKKLVAKANEAAKSKTNAAGTLHYPVVLGILDGWRAHGKQFIFVPDPALLSLFYKGDWFDINEGTQRRIHYKVWQFAQLRGYTGWKAPVFDKEKNQRYIHNARILGMGQAADVVAPLFVAEGLFRVVPALAKGIPGAVRTLRAHKAWVGTKNYLQSAKVAKPVAKEVPLKPAPAAQQVTPKSTKSAQLSVAKVDNNTVQILPKGYTVEQLNPGRTNIAPKTFASTGDGVAPGKPLSNAKQAKADKFQYKSQRQQDKRIYKEAEEMMQPAQTAPAAPRTLSWKDKARFQWEANFKPAFQNVFKFGTSRYGLSALGTGAAPVTSEAAIMANTPVIAQTVRAQQSTFIAEEFLRGGAGASYRVGAVNPGGVAAAHYAQAALNAVNPATQAAKILTLSLGASRAAQTVAPRYGNGMAYSMVFPVPSFIMNRLLQARIPAEDGTEVTGGGTATQKSSATESQAQNQQELVASTTQKLAQIYQGGNVRSPREQRKVDRVVKRLAERLPQLEDFARKHNGRLPQTSATTSLVNYTTEDEASLINSIARDIDFLEGQGFRNDPLSQRYAALVEGHKNYLVTNLSAALDQLEEYARTHNGSLPYKSTFKNYGTEPDLLLREQIVQNINFLKNLIAGKSWEKRDHTLAERCEPLFQRYNRLNQAHQQKLKDERNAVLRAERQVVQEETRQRKLQQKEDKRREEEERQQIQKDWEEEQARLEKQARIEEAAVRRQDKEWAQYEEALADETTADRAARVADSRIAWLGQTTEDFIAQLVSFYNNINPFGNAALNIPFNKPEQWADELEKFIDKHHRAPLRYYDHEITSQQMKDEHRLAKAVYGLSDRLPADNPDKIRIDALLSRVGMDKQTREQRRFANFDAARQKHYQNQVENARQSHKNLYEQLGAYLQENQRYPLSSSYLYRTIQGRLKYYQSTMTADGKYADPYLQKIYELKMAVQAASTGKFTITPDGKGEYVLEIEQSALEEMEEEEISPTVKKAQSRSIRVRINEQVKQIMEGVKEQDSLERHNFIDWVQKMHSSENRDLIATRKTSDALYLAATKEKEDEGRTNGPRQKVSDLINSLSNIRRVLGDRPPTFYKLIYHGDVGSRIPLASNFHVVAEETGIFREELEVMQAEEFLQQHPLHGVFMEGNETHVNRIGFNKGLTPEQAAKDLEALLNQLTPVSYVYRMGEHELGLVENKSAFRTGQLHIHIEHIATEPNAVGLFTDVSLKLKLNAWRFAGRYQTNPTTGKKEFVPFDDKVIAENYQKIFAKYLSGEGKQALNKLTNPTSGPTSAGGGSTPIGPRYRR